MPKLHNAIVIASAARTPLGNFLGCLASLSAPELGAVAIESAVARAGIAKDNIDEVLMGCVLPAGVGQAPARQAAMLAGLPDSIPATTINKVCGSGMKAIMLGHDLIRAGSAKMVVAGGMESMSNTPYLVPKARQGLRIGHAELLDHMFLDGLEDFQHKRLMGSFAEECAKQFQIKRAQQDTFARDSLSRARLAIEKGWFQQEISPVTIRDGAEIKEISEDEHPYTVTADKIDRLKPVFKRDGTVTAANSSSISDGAAAVVLMSESCAQQHGIQPLARIISHTSYASEPAWFTTAPITAIQQILDQLKLTVSDIDLFEINEAFAVVVLVAMQELGLPWDKVNIHGGACALGHPIGASGARIVVTLLSAMHKYDYKRGLATLCIGGGEATAMVIER